MSTPNMGLTLPTDKGSTDTWDSILDAVFGLIDAHDHSIGKGVKVPSAGIGINADISWSLAGTPYALSDAKAIDFTPVAVGTVASFAAALFTNSADNELYWRTTGGTNVKLTAGNALNVAAFTGGIGGDYSAVGALLSYDDATRRYLLQQEGAPRPWAGAATGDIDLYQKAASIVNKVTLKSPSALAASYPVVFPAALPFGETYVTMDAAGNIKVATTTTTIGGPRYTGVADIQVIGAMEAVAAAPAATFVAPGQWNLLTSTGGLYYPLRINAGDRIVQWGLFIQKSSGGNLTASLHQYDATTSTDTVVSTQTLTGALGRTNFNPSGLAINSANAAISFYIVIAGNGTTGDIAYSAYVGTVRP